MSADKSPESGLQDSALRDWRVLADRLVPVIGQRGLRTLYLRSLHLTRAAHPCLGPALPDEDANIESLLTSLRSSLQEQTPARAQAAHEALLNTFIELLKTLFGRGLTEQILHPAQPDGEGIPHRSNKS